MRLLEQHDFKAVATEIEELRTHDQIALANFPGDGPAPLLSQNRRRSKPSTYSKRRSVRRPCRLDWRAQPSACASAMLTNRSAATVVGSSRITARPWNWAARIWCGRACGLVPNYCCSAPRRHVRGRGTAECGHPRCRCRRTRRAPCSPAALLQHTLSRCRRTATRAGMQLPAALDQAGYECESRRCRSGAQLQRGDFLVRRRRPRMWPTPTPPSSSPQGLCASEAEASGVVGLPHPSGRARGESQARFGNP